MKKILGFIKRRWYLVLIALLIIGFIFYKTARSKDGNNKENSYVLKSQDIKDSLTLSGQIDAGEKANLRFQASGRLAWVGVKEGDMVKKYQAIAALDQRDVKNRLSKYLQSFSIQRNSFDSTVENNWDKQYDFSQKVRDDAQRLLQNNQYNLESAVLDVEYQNLAVEYSNLYTPIDGIITRIDTPYPGVNVTPAGAEFDVVNPKTIYFSATADQTDVVKLKNGIKGEIVFDAYPDETFKGTLYYTAFTPQTNETGTVYELRFSLDQNAMAKNLKMGMTGDLDILLNEYKNSLSAPTSFIKKDRKGNYVNEKENGKQVKKYIEVGREINGNTIIKNGAASGDVIYD